MTEAHDPARSEPRPPAKIGHDLAASFAELWGSVRHRAIHVFDKLHADDLLAVKGLDDLKRIIKAAYQYDDDRIDAEIDRFVNEGGATPSSPR